jgi:hypothetical protein
VGAAACRERITMTDTSASAPPTTSLYKYVDVAGLRRILQGCIRFTQPSAFNDPFELLPEIVMPSDEPERRISVSFNIRAKRRHPPVGDVQELPENWVGSDATSRDIVQQLNDLIGIFCLSKRNDSLLMWAHYADNYAGAVVEFDGSHGIFTDQIDVEYKPLRPKKHISAYAAANEPIPVSELCVKSDQWEYEQEVRVVRCLSECEKLGQDKRRFPVYVQQIPPACVKSVILGERTPVTEQREIYARVMDTDIALLLAAVDHAGYTFRHEIIKYNVPYSKMGPVMSPRTAHIFSELQSQYGEFARWMVNNHPLSKIVNKPV